MRRAVNPAANPVHCASCILLTSADLEWQLMEMEDEEEEEDDEDSSTSGDETDEQSMEPSKETPKEHGAGVISMDSSQGQNLAIGDSMEDGTVV